MHLLFFPTNYNDLQKKLYSSQIRFDLWAFFALAGFELIAFCKHPLMYNAISTCTCLMKYHLIAFTTKVNCTSYLCTFIHFTHTIVYSFFPVTLIYIYIYTCIYMFIYIVSSNLQSLLQKTFL